MGKYDTCMKKFLQNKDRFADLFNGSCFQGRQIIKKKMIELMKDETYSHLNEDTWDAIAVMTDNAAMLQKKDLYKTKNQKEEFNMCQALQELMQDERNEGRIEGRIEGKIEDQKIVIRNMINRGYKTEDICAIAECSPAFVKEVETELALT